MTHIQIKIQSKEDAKKGPAFPEVGERASKFYDLPVQKVSILQGGMVSGKTSLALIAEAADGTAVLMQISADQLEAISSAVRGAEARWSELKS